MKCSSACTSVGALALLGPGHAGRQRHLAGAVEEVVVAHRVQDGALRVGQHDHALGVDDLLEQHLHHRRSVREQALVAFLGDVEVAAHQRRVVGPLDARQPERSAALVRLLDEVDVAGLALRRGRGAVGAAPAAWARVPARGHEGCSIARPIGRLSPL
jgi:hypothetical protein